MQILDLLGITMETELEITTDGYGLFIVPNNHPDIKKIRQMHKGAILRYALEEKDEDETARSKAVKAATADK